MQFGRVLFVSSFVPCSWHGTVVWTAPPKPTVVITHSTRVNQKEATGHIHIATLSHGLAHYTDPQPHAHQTLHTMHTCPHTIQIHAHAQTHRHMHRHASSTPRTHKRDIERVQIQPHNPHTEPYIIRRHLAGSAAMAITQHNPSSQSLPSEPSFDFPYDPILTRPGDSL